VVELLPRKHLPGTQTPYQERKRKTERERKKKEEGRKEGRKEGWLFKTSVVIYSVMFSYFHPRGNIFVVPLSTSPHSHINGKHGMFSSH
jgi:hypothetical protein